MMSSRLWVASRTRAIRDHSQTESGRPFVHFPFRNAEIVLYFGVLFRSWPRQNYFFSPFASNKPSSTDQSAPQFAYEESVWSKHFVGVREGSLWMCQVFSPFSKQRQPRPISKRRPLEPDTDEETDAGAN